LDEWAKWTAKPTLREYSILAERTTEAGRVSEPRLVRVQVWEPTDETDSYVLVADPSTGVRSRTHDPAGFQVWSRRKRKLVARYNDYLEPYGLGYLIGLVAKDYNNALVDVDMTGGYGGPTITALSNLRYHNINRDYHEYRPGSSTSQLGFRITHENRAEITDAIQRALVDDSVTVPSDEVLSCLKGCTVDERGKFLAAPGRHDEDMICMGRALHLMDTLGVPAPRIVTALERAKRMFAPYGAVVEREPDEDQSLLEEWMDA
jgi:hypothetical protein